MWDCINARQRRLDDGVGREARRDRFEIGDSAGRAAAGHSGPSCWVRVRCARSSVLCGQGGCRPPFHRLHRTGVIYVIIRCIAFEDARRNQRRTSPEFRFENLYIWLVWTAASAAVHWRRAFTLETSPVIRPSSAPAVSSPYRASVLGVAPPARRGGDREGGLCDVHARNFPR